MLHSINYYCMFVFLKFIYIYFFLYYKGPCVRKLFIGLIMYYPLKIKNIVLYCIVSPAIVSEYMCTDMRSCAIVIAGIEP